jgi:hypothetical protein
VDYKYHDSTIGKKTSHLLIISCFQTQKSPAMDTPRTKPDIPTSLDAKGRKVYETLLQVIAQRITHKEASPNVVVVTDLAADLDDLLAMVELDPLHDLGLIK